MKSLQKTEKGEKLEVKRRKSKGEKKEATYELPEIPDYERAVLEKPQEFEFSEFQRRDKTKLLRPETQVRELSTFYSNKIYPNFFNI